MSTDAVVTLIVGLFGGGTVAAVVDRITSYRKGVREQDVEADQTAFQQMQAILSEHKQSIASLKADGEQGRKRLDDLAEENRLFRWTLIGVMDRLKQMPPLTPTDILDYIREHVPAIGKDRP